jgi:hypothetical protein
MPFAASQAEIRVSVLHAAAQRQRILVHAGQHYESMISDARSDGIDELDTRFGWIVRRAHD